jgi:hypothetical protein
LTALTRGTLPPDGSVDVKPYSNFYDTFLILIVCGILQVGSNGLSFWAFRQSTAHLSEVEKSNIQRNALMQTRAWLLQASTR